MIFTPMEREEVDELVLHLEDSLDLTNISTGIQLIGCIIASKVPNIGSIKNILRKGWSNFGEVKISHVNENIFSIVAENEAFVGKIVEASPWSVMRHCFSVKYWPSDMAMEDPYGSVLGASAWDSSKSDEYRVCWKDWWKIREGAKAGR